MSNQREKFLAAVPFLEHALTTALDQHNELMGEVHPISPGLDIHDESDFWALVERDRNGVVIRVSGGVVNTVGELWSAAFADETFLGGADMPFVGDKDDAIHVSLVWLMLHELQHITLGHFDLLGQDYMAETHRANQFALVSRSRANASPLVGVDTRVRYKFESCLELQADHDAIELVLDAYSPDDRQNLRAQVAAISAMMMLIEREDDRNGQVGSTHPKAATRIFQLLGHVAEMWSLPAHMKAKQRGESQVQETDLPSEEEKQAFSEEVILPAYWDAVALADVAGAKSIISDLGSPEDFFADIANAKLGHWDDLKTVGAREWAKLWSCNEALKPILGGHFTN